MDRISELEKQLEQEREKVEKLDAMYRQQLGDRDKRIEDLDGSAKIWMGRYTQLQALVETIKCELFDRYDGAPDSPTRWMGSLIRDIKIAQALPATPTERGQE